jgi:hypothetical protein
MFATGAHLQQAIVEDGDLVAAPLKLGRICRQPKQVSPASIALQYSILNGDVCWLNVTLTSRCKRWQRPHSANPAAVRSLCFVVMHDTAVHAAETAHKQKGT